MEASPELANSSCSRLPMQKSSAHLPNLSKDQAGRVAWQGLMRGTPLDHSCGRVARRALERRRVQQRCPRGFSGTALGHRPQNRTKGAGPKDRQSQRRNVFLPGCSVFSLSWPACAGAFLVPCPWFSDPAPSGSFYVSFHWPRASQGPAFFRYHPLCSTFTFSRVGLGYVVIFTTADDFSLKCVGDVFSQFWVTGHFWFLFSTSPLHVRLLLSHSSHLRWFRSVSRRPSFGWP